MTDETPKSETKKTGAGFFAVGADEIRSAIAKGLNAGVAYLVLARFSDSDNRISRASVHAIETHTAISRKRAAMAIELLVGHELVKRKRGPDGRPLHDLIPSPYGYSGGRPRGERQLVWIPNRIVTSVGDETPPLERVRQAQDPMLLRMLVDLYGAQDLADEGGIDRRIYRAKHERVRLADRGAFVVWGFRRSMDVSLTWGSPITDCHKRRDGDAARCGDDFFDRADTLRDLGLLEWTTSIVESDLPGAEIMFGFDGPTGSIEREIEMAATDAGWLMLEEGPRARVEAEDLVPVPLLRHMGAVQAVSIARLRFRPHTAKSKAWWAEHHRLGALWAERFRALARDPTGPLPQIWKAA